MPTLSTLRLHVRDLVRTAAYAELDRYYNELEAQWLEAPTGSHPYIDATQAGTLFDYSTQSYVSVAQFLQAWIAACPEAYHPQLIWGKFCFGRATDIRGYGWAQGVSQDCWLGAAMACEGATAALLTAMQRSSRPVAAGLAMLQLSSHFQEPAWLLELFRQQPAVTCAANDQEPELLAQALAHLADYGLSPLAQPPQALPDLLPTREAHEMDQGQDYWLHQILQWRPACLEALLAYTNYLRPRWGGSYEDIEGLASGPLATGLDEAQRNAIRWIGAYDAISDYPAADEVSTAQAFQARFEAWLQRDLRPEERGDALGRFANFCSYSLNDEARAYSLHVASVAAFAPGVYFREVDGPFHSFAYLTLIHQMTAHIDAFKEAIERMCRMDELATPLALAAVGHEFALWGFAHDAERARTLLNRAAMLSKNQIDDNFNILTAGYLLWDSGAHEAGYYLIRQCAERRVHDASSAMYDIHRGSRSNTPESYINDAAREFWLERAVADGSALAKYNMAWDRLFSQGLDFNERKHFNAVRQLLQESREDQRCEAFARLRIGVLQRDFGTLDEQEEGVQGYLRSLIDDQDDWTAARACAEIALGYMNGRGAKRSRFAAIEWAQHATRLLPDNEGIEEIEREVLNSHSLVKTMGTVVGAFFKRGNISPDDLPPKPAS